MQLSMRIKVPDYKKKMKISPYYTKDGQMCFPLTREGDSKYQEDTFVIDGV